MDRVIRDGKVAVLVSRGYGAGWVSWEGTSPFTPQLVNAIEAGVKGEALVDIADCIYPDAYNGGAADLEINWIAQGSLFRITEYDGAESLEVRDDMDWFVA